MKAITYTQFGQAKDVLTAEDIATPTPKDGEVLVRLETSAVNPSDVKVRAGGRPGVTKPPFEKIVPHSDGAGVIDAVGSSVDKSRIGERVWIYNGQWQRAFGTAAEYITIPSEQAVKLPDNISFETGAMLGIPAMTACHAVLSGGGVAGKTVLVSGGAGTVGHLSVQIAAQSGAYVIATARGDAGIAAAKAAGAKHVFDYQSDNLAAEILEATSGKFIDRIVEVEFGKNAETNAQLIAERGTIASFGSAKVMAPQIPFYPFMFKAITIDLILVYILSTQERDDTTAKLTALLENDALDFRINEVFTLSQCADAHEQVEKGTRTGGTILKI